MAKERTSGVARAHRHKNAPAPANDERRNFSALQRGRADQPLPLTRTNITLMQRTAGNRAVTRWVNGAGGAPQVMQRVIAAPNFNVQGGAEQQRLQAIATAVTNYNQLDQASPNANELKARFSAITALERLIYAWYGSKQVPDLADNTDNALGGNATAMRTLLRGTESERDTVVTGLRAGGHSITFAGANPGAIANLENLWTAIVNQTGNLKAIGQASETDRLFSRIAATLQTDAGREILDFMVNRNPKTVTMLFATQANLQTIAARSGKPQQEQATFVNDHIDSSFAGQENFGLESTMVKDTTGQPGTPLTTPDAFIQDVTGANPSARYSAGGVTYKRGTAHDSFAAVKDAPVLDDQRAKASSAGGTEVLTPTFITLMHELGHALKMASGTYMPSNTMLHPELAGHFLPTQGDKDNWPASGVEEHVNVLGVENPIRQQSQVSTRDSYETPENVALIQARVNAEQSWAALRAADPLDASQYLEAVLQRCDRNMAPLFHAENIFMATTAAAVANRLQPIQGLLNPAQQLNNKRAYVTNADNAFRLFLQSLAANERAHIRRTQRYQNLNQRLTDLLVNNQLALNPAVRQCDVVDQVTRFTRDKDQLIAAGKKIRHINRYGRWSPGNWGAGGMTANEGQP